MGLERLKILIEESLGEFSKEVEALFNPNQITIQKSTAWRRKPKPESDTGKTQFVYGEPATLSMELFFDTYTYRFGADVRDYTREIFSLTTVKEHGNLHRPPLCKLEWGSFNISSDYQCAWVLQSLNQRFTLFRADGIPVRATLGCTFRQWRGDELEAKLLDRKSADVAKTRVVRRGDTLSNVAHREYGDPGRWRPIAEANRIDDPRHLTPGERLIIPALRTRGTTGR